MPLFCSDPTGMTLTRDRGRWTCVASKKRGTWRACSGGQVWFSMRKIHQCWKTELAALKAQGAARGACSWRVDSGRDMSVQGRGMDVASSLGVQYSLIGALFHACLLSWQLLFWAH